MIRKLFASNPQDAEGYFNRGNARRQSGDLVGAIADYTEALRLNPQDAEAYTSRGFSVWVMSGDLTEALKDLDEAIRIRPSVARYDIRGEMYFAMQKYDLARADFEESLRLQPEFEYAKAGLAISLYGLGETVRAYALWRELLAQDESYRDADAVGKKLNWATPLIEEARRLIGGME